MKKIKFIKDHPFAELGINLHSGIFSIHTYENNAGASLRNKIIFNIIFNLSPNLSLGFLENKKYVDLIINLNNKEYLLRESDKYINFKYIKYSLPHKIIKDNNICIIKTGPDMIRHIFYNECELAVHIHQEDIRIHQACDPNKKFNRFYML